MCINEESGMLSANYRLYIWGWSFFSVDTDQEILSFCSVSSFAAAMTISTISSVYFSAPGSHQGIEFLHAGRLLSDDGEY